MQDLEGMEGNMRGMVLFTLMVVYGLAQIIHPSVVLNWNWSQGSGPVADGFHIQRGNSSGGPYSVVGTVSSGIFTFTDTSVVGANIYYYVVTAFNAGGGDSVNSNEIQASVPIDGGSMEGVATLAGRSFIK